MVGDQLRVGDAELVAWQFAIRGGDAGEGALVDAPRHGVLEGDAKARQVDARHAQARSHGVAAERPHEARVAARAVGDGVADVQARNRAGGTLEQVRRRVVVREDHRRAVVALAQSRRDDAYHALVPAGLVDADRRVHGVAYGLFFDQRQRIGAHFRFDLPPIDVQRIERLGRLARFGGVLFEQARDAQRHVLQPSGGVQARADGEAQVRGGELRLRPPGDLHQRLNARPRPAGANAPQALMHQDAVVAVERNDVGHGAHGDEIEPVGQVRFRPGVEVPTCAQHAAHGAHQVVGDADAGQMRARESGVRQVRIHQRERGRQFLARQVVVGHHHIHASRARHFHAVDARYAVVHRHQHLRLALQSDAHQFGRQSIAELETVGDEKADVLFVGAERPQQRDAERGSRGAVGIEVADDQDALALLHSRRQPLRRPLDVGQRVRGMQFGKPQLQVRRRDRAARRQRLAKELRQRRVERLRPRLAGLDPHRPVPWPLKQRASSRRGRRRGCASRRRRRQRGRPSPPPPLPPPIPTRRP